MARQIGLGMTDPQVVLLESRVNALNARLRALETRQDRDRPADATAESRGTTGGMEPIVEALTEAESLRLIEQAEIGRIGFSGRFGPAILPVNFKVLDGSVVFRTEADSPLGEDLRTGIAHAEYKVAFEIDEIDKTEKTGWSVLIQGAVHYVEDEEERAVVVKTGVQPWAGGERDLYVRIKPTFISGRRIRRV
jgi:nitroimidazol reductase NimA-like FMN-containing flavoprotein (pyridoxamine 5'-phosphate oxidase superfamily)